MIKDLFLKNAGDLPRKRLEDFKKLIAEKPVVVFGCGNLGKKIGDFLCLKNFDLVAYTDNNKSLWETKYGGINILSPANAIANFPEAVFIVGIWSPNRSFAQFKNQLVELGAKEIFHASSLFLSFPNALLPYYHFQQPEFFLAHQKEIEQVYNLLADEESKKQYAAHVNCRINLDFEGLPEPDLHNQYFPDGVIQLSQEEVFLDAGAYNGDSLEDFCKRTNLQYKKIIALEPDPENFRQLNQKIKELNAPNITSLPYAIGAENCYLQFEATAGGNALIAESGNLKVQCVKTDDYFLSEGVTYFKMDIEGAEMNALLGSERLITMFAPKLAVCIYHLPDDLWTMPLYLMKKYPNYNYFVRTHQFDGLDFVLYGIPK